MKQRLKNNISSRTIRKSNKLLYDGYLFIPECNLIIDSPIKTCVEVHGFGKGDTEINALMHEVIGQKLARQVWKIRYRIKINTHHIVSHMKFNIKYKNYQKYATDIMIELIEYISIQSELSREINLLDH